MQRIEKVPPVFEISERGTRFVYTAYNKDEKIGLFHATYTVREKFKNYFDVEEDFETSEARIKRRLKIYKNGKIMEILENVMDYPIQANNFPIYLKYIDPSKVEVGKTLPRFGRCYEKVVSQEYLDYYPVYHCVEVDPYTIPISPISHNFYHSLTGLMLKKVRGAIVIELASTNFKPLTEYRGESYPIPTNAKKKFVDFDPFLLERMYFDG